VVISWSFAGKETGRKVIILIMAVPDGNSRNDGQLRHALDAEVIHAVGAVSGMYFRGQVDVPRCGGGIC
jgi:hypothetical protein